MSRFRIHRMADGVRVEGTSRHIFIRNGDTYYLADMLIFADGVIDCWGPTDLAGLREMLESGWVATSFEPGGRASAHHLAAWRFAEPRSSVEPEMLLGEVADEIDRLNDRPDSIGRCRLAVADFMRDRTEDNRAVVLERYLAIPGHLRCYSLGDMDAKDWPLRVLATPVGRRTPGPHDEVVTVEMHEAAVEYFEEQEADLEEHRKRVPPDGPAEPQAATVTIRATVYPRGWPENVGVEALQPAYPAAITIDGRDYPSVEHAYWALSTTDEQSRDRIVEAPRAFDARELAESAPRRGDWAEVRLAVMVRLLRAKFDAHPRLAKLLLSTGDGRIVCAYWTSSFWDSQGTNWIGRLLEVVRSELAARRALAGARNRDPARPGWGPVACGGWWTSTRCWRNLEPMWTFCGISMPSCWRST